MSLPSVSDVGRMASVRRMYGVPARRGAEIVYSGYGFPIAGRIISCDGSHLYMRANDGRRVGPLHPTWAIDYGDHRDYGRETNERIELWNEWLNHRIERPEYLDRLRALPKRYLPGYERDHA